MIKARELHTAVLLASVESDRLIYRDLCKIHDPRILATIMPMFRRWKRSDPSVSSRPEVNHALKRLRRVFPLLDIELIKELIEFLIEHQDEIIAIISLIISLFGEQNVQSGFGKLENRVLSICLSVYAFEEDVEVVDLDEGSASALVQLFETFLGSEV